MEKKNGRKHLLWDKRWKKIHIDKIFSLYVENEVEELKFQVSMASRNLAIGRELIKIEKIIQKEGGHYEFIINDIFIGENGKQKIDPNTRMLSKRIAEIQDIDEYIWLGWKNLVLLVKQFDNKSKIVIKDILKEMDIDENTPRNDVIKQILSKISQYRIYKFVKKINDLVMFKSIVYGLEKGLDFSNRELLKLIKNSKRPDMVIRNFKKKSITESKSNQTKRTLYDESESIITKVNEILNNVLKIGKFSDSIDTYLLIKLYQNLIDADNTLNYNILIDMCNDDEHIDLLIQDLLK